MSAHAGHEPEPGSAARVRRALCTTEAMLRAADAGDWLEVAVLEGVRASELAPLLAGAGETAPQPLLARLAQLNGRLQVLAAAHRDDLSVRTRAARHGARAARAYGVAAG